MKGGDQDASTERVWTKRKQWVPVSTANACPGVKRETWEGRRGQLKYGQEKLTTQETTRYI